MIETKQYEENNYQIYLIDPKIFEVLSMLK